MLFRILCIENTHTRSTRYTVQSLSAWYYMYVTHKVCMVRGSPAFAETEFFWVRVRRSTVFLHEEKGFIYQKNPHTCVTAGQNNHAVWFAQCLRGESHSLRDKCFYWLLNFHIARNKVCHWSVLPYYQRAL